MADSSTGRAFRSRGLTANSQEWTEDRSGEPQADWQEGYHPRSRGYWANWSGWHDHSGWRQPNRRSNTWWHGSWNVINTRVPAGRSESTAIEGAETNVGQDAPAGQEGPGNLTAVADANVGQDAPSSQQGPRGQATPSSASEWELIDGDGSGQNPLGSTASEVTVAREGGQVVPGSLAAVAETNVDEHAPAGQEGHDNHTAVADINVGQPATAGQEGRDSRERSAVFDLAFFRELQVTRGYKQHNVALKWFRDSLEVQGVDSFTFSNVDAHAVPAIVHNKGPLYTFDEQNASPWKWQEMVAQLDAESMGMLVEGLKGSGTDCANRSRGIVSCRIQKTDRYDHKRHHALKHEGHTEMLMIWDFVLVRDDGSQIFLHPNYTTTKFSGFVGPSLTDCEIPRTGLGGTSGRGTYKYFKDKLHEFTLRFRGKGQSNARSSADPASLATTALAAQHHDHA